ncbi:hypothetical protein PLANPX_4917 [Lacipirellula parvula]|uniref:Uncharacterized protein n=1 Tax=Lacipirellula parvula TaxID=2650471 RepID=A0A5K7XFY3_9BACT|nr:hypothetical protein PLANPX_4917 [Lacipirellula parvula]
MNKKTHHDDTTDTTRRTELATINPTCISVMIVVPSWFNRISEAT